MWTPIRTTLHAIITTPKLDDFAVVRFPKDVARRVNLVLGSPICSAAEIERRKNAVARLAALRSSARVRPTTREPMPITVYVEKDRNVREIERVKALLGASNIPTNICDVTGDEATLAFVMNKAKCEADDLPIAFAGPDPIGSYNDLVAWDVDGRLNKAVFGPSAGPSRPKATSHAS